MDPRQQVRRMRYQQEAMGYLELGMMDHVLTTIGRLDEAGQTHPVSLYLRGEALRALARHEEAVPVLIEAARRDPAVSEVWLAIGWCQKRLGRLDLAIDALKQAADQEPYNPLVLYNLACYYSLTGEKEKSIEYLIDALAIDPEYDRLIDGEPDFDPIRHDPDFLALRKSVMETAIGSESSKPEA